MQLLYFNVKNGFFFLFMYIFNEMLLYKIGIQNRVLAKREAAIYLL